MAPAYGWAKSQTNEWIFFLRKYYVEIRLIHGSFGELYQTPSVIIVKCKGGFRTNHWNELVRKRPWPTSVYYH